ncbi:ribosomal protein L10e/L16 [Catenaria anguillulae PL171]|uniref:Ribosomal protein L10e/L16 n=1 Tax=Catenaria anguillulae PL171 TaxID=765915 RepID=A0A1Y2HN87_9FUNG|nr:ribosomal protein L10e/L16 [Catenaria anguillulae PL171]
MLSLARAFSRLQVSAAPTAGPTAVPSALVAAPKPHIQRRFAGEIVHPRKTRFRKAHKGRVPLPIGGSISGTTLQHGDYALVVREGGRLSAAQLEAARRIIRRKIRPVKGCEMWLRVFPDIPVTSKGNETRMGKGKGTLEYYMCRVPMNRVVFEIGGGGLRWEVAKDALRQAGMRLPVATTIVTKQMQEREKREATLAAAAAVSSASAVSQEVVAEATAAVPKAAQQPLSS